MTHRIVYLVGRPKDLNNVMSLNLEGIMIVLPNYTEVKLTPPTLEELPGDCAVFRLRVAEDKLDIREEGDRHGRREIARLWDGPRNRRDMPQCKIKCFVELELSHAKAAAAAADTEAGDDSAVTDEQLRKANDDLLAKVGELTKERDDLQAQLDVATTPTVELLKDFVTHASDEVLEAMPHIGPETVAHLRAWAQEG